VGAANKSRVGRCKNYDLFLFLIVDKLQTTTNRVLLKYVVSIKAVRNKFILKTNIQSLIF